MKRITSLSALCAAAVLLVGLSGVFARGSSIFPVQKRQGIVDANGDGICDLTGQRIGPGAGVRQGQAVPRGKQYGPGDSTGNQGVGPRDGTGYGARSRIGNGPLDCSQPRTGQGAGTRARRGGRP